MKQLLITIAAVVLVGCASTQLPESPTVKAPDISIFQAALDGNIKAVKQHLASGGDVNTTDHIGRTPLHWVASKNHKDIVELLITEDADVNAKTNLEGPPLDQAIGRNHTETAELLRKHGGKTGEELKAEGK